MSRKGKRGGGPNDPSEKTRARDAFFAFCKPSPQNVQKTQCFFNLILCGMAKSSKAFGLLAKFSWILRLFSSLWGKSSTKPTARRRRRNFFGATFFTKIRFSTKKCVFDFFRQKNADPIRHSHHLPATLPHGRQCVYRKIKNILKYFYNAFARPL